MSLIQQIQDDILSTTPLTNEYFMKLICFILITLFAGCINGQQKQNADLAGFISSRAIDLKTSNDLDKLIESAGSKKLVMLGESTHGTSEYYLWRSEISKRLIAEKGSSFIVVEGDWASIYRLNKYVKDLPGALKTARDAVRTFNRWPEWMWANEEVVELAEWLRSFNDELPMEKKVGFYGLDVYGQWDAMQKLIDYAETELPDDYEIIKANLECFLAYGYDEWQYARAVTQRGNSCEPQLYEVVNILKAKAEELQSTDKNKYFNAKQNALVVKNAEEYYRLAVRNGTDSWNSRVHHMDYTITRLLDYYDNDSKGIVWAHNTHIGDAGATSMLQQNMVNIGHIKRNELGRENVFLVGFSTYSGKVMAGSQWGAQRLVMNIPSAQLNSIEDLFNLAGKDSYYLVFSGDDRKNDDLMQMRGHRAIGVVFNPLFESRNYVPTILPERYDAFVFFKETAELKPVD